MANQLPKLDMSTSTTNCCPRFDPAPWDGQTFTFNDKPFMHVSTRSFFHIPLNMGSVMKHAMAKVDAAGAATTDFILLSAETSAWKADHYLAVEHDVPGADMVRLSGTYLAKVFEGPFQNAPQWHAQMMDFVKQQGQTPKQMYFYYTTCPGCAKVYGKNYVVGFAQVA